MKRAGVVMGVVLAATNVFAWNEPTGFRDVPFGSSEEQLRQNIPAMSCGGETLGFLPERRCSGYLNIGQVEIYTQFGFRNGGLSRVSFFFRSKDFSSIETAFTAKYGQPTGVEEQNISTRGGLQALNRTLHWRGTKITIRLERYTGSLNDSSGDIETVEEEREQQRRFDEQEKAGAKDL